MVRNRTARQTVDLSPDITITRSGVIRISGISPISGDPEINDTVSEDTSLPGAATQLLVNGCANGHELLVDIWPVALATQDIADPGDLIFITVFDPSSHLALALDKLATLAGLTKSETEVAELILDGRSTDQIAVIRNVKVGTVQNQVKSVLAKTGSRSRIQLLRKAIGIVLPGENDK
ncbi:MAG: helix-turn-helix transcriptional regulator [Rhodospirillales bacterium]